MFDVFKGNERRHIHNKGIDFMSSHLFHQFSFFSKPLSIVTNKVLFYSTVNFINFTLIKMSNK